ncbi:MAG TPA: lysophospholipase [Kofleriaceae bacterium]|nr:lysophospholipase [Kofleriaceae bacterium]
MHLTRLLSLSILGSLAVACAPVDPGLRATFPGRTQAPADVDWADTHVAGAGGLELYVQRWRPKSGEPKAVVLLHHGLADHSTRYAAFAAQLVAAGYTVWAFDARGHGRSAGARVKFDRFDDLLDDLDAVVARVRAEEPGRKVFLFGHSLGGLVTSLYTIERQPDIGGLVLASPGLVLDIPPLLAAATPVLATLAGNAPALEIVHAGFSKRREVVEEMDHDPLISQVKAPAQSARTSFEGVARVWAAPERLTAPLLVFHGTEDIVTAPAGSRDLYARAGSKDKLLRIHDGLMHDTLREPEGAGERVASEVIAWLDAHSGGAPVTFTSSELRPGLRGDRRGSAIAFELDARGEQARDGALGDRTGATAGLRVRFGAGRATALGLGYFGGVDVRGGVLDGGYYQADAHALGVALRGAGGAVLAVTGGAGIGGVRSASATHAPVELTFELPAGPVRLLSRASLAWRLGGPDYADDAFGIADEASALLGLRIGRDHRYWAQLAGGSGPFVGVTYRNLGGAELYGVAVGVNVWGGN